jgi:hypothetical protein
VRRERGPRVSGVLKISAGTLISSALSTVFASVYSTDFQDLAFLQCQAFDAFKRSSFEWASVVAQTIDSCT